MTRRQFLALLGVGVGGVPSAIAADAVPSEAPAATAPTATGPTNTPSTAPSPWDGIPSSKSTIVEVGSPRVIAGHDIHQRRLAEMISLTLRHVTGKDTDADAWHDLLEPEDVIGLKFNRSGAAGLGTTEPVARLLVASLNKAGWGPDRIVLIETDPRLARELKTQPRRRGWQTDLTRFGSGVDRLATVLEQVTAIVNVPFLKANRIAGMSGCLKNLSHALVKHPGHYHHNAKPDRKRGVLKRGARCAPYVGDIVASPAIRSKLRLHLVNALRTVREPVPDPTSTVMESYGALLAGRDPVAVDMIGLEILNQQRAARSLPPLAEQDEPLPHIRAAGEAGLGTWNPDFIDHRTVRA